MRSWSVSVDNNSFDSAGITKDCQDAITEYIWNGFEASATEVIVEIVGEVMQDPPGIIIRDNGTGIHQNTLHETFGAFLSSQKKSKHLRIKTHTNKGKGRFSYLAIAPSAVWKTRYARDGGVFAYEIRLSSQNKAQVEESEAVECPNGSTGTDVIIPVNDSKTMAQLQWPNIKKKLMSEFAWFLYLNKAQNMTVSYAGNLLDYNEYINESLSREQSITIDGYTFAISIIVWNNKIDNSSKIYYLDDGAFVRDVENTSFNKNSVEFHHSVFVRSAFFDTIPVLKNAEDASIVEYAPGQRTIMKKLKKQIKEYVDSVLRSHLLLKADSFLADQEAKSNIPAFSNDEIGQAKKADFLTVTREIYCAEPRIFYHLKPKPCKSLLGFISLLLDSDERENILTVIEQIVDLTPEQRSKFASILKVTSLKHIIEIADILQKRYAVVQELTKIVYDPDVSRFANERDHIQKIVEQHYWLFGDQYNLVSADIQIKKSLKEFEKYLGLAEREDTVLSADELRQRMDIVLYGSRNTEDDCTEGLIVELKAPQVPLSTDVLGQITRYANIVRKEPRFSGSSRKWKFYAVCSRVDDDVKAQYDGYRHLEKYCLAQVTGNFEIYALSWDDVFLSFQRRYKFIIDKLRDDYEAYCSENPETDIVDRTYVDERVKALTNISLA